MVRFEDLMAARFLYQQLPERRDVLLAGLEALREGGARSLLSGLVQAEVLTMEQAHYVHRQVEGHKRERALAIYGHLLAGAGVAAGALAQAREQAGKEADTNAVGEALVAQGALPAAREQQLRFQARLALDRDMANQVQAHLEAHSPAALSQAQLRTSGVLRNPLPQAKGLFSSQVIKGPPPEAAPEANEVQALLRGTLSDADSDLPGPQFPIPSRVDMSDPRTGKQLKGYRILGRIGAGAMGVVYLADRQEEPTRPVALKLLPKDAPEDARGRFKREILANSFFSHPGALEVYDAGETEHGYHYLAMEYFEGDDLEKVLAEAKKLPAGTALELARQVFETLGASHEAGVVHRDVKPSNILVSPQLETVKLMDFGIAKIRDLDGSTFEAKVFSTLEGGVTGTPEYMSPEQAAGESLSAASDLYSMGVVLYHALAGRLPFESETSGGFMTCHMIEEPAPLVKVAPHLKTLPKEVLDLLDALLQKDPKRRPASAKVVVDVLALALPKVKQQGTSRFLSFLGWRKS